jgi:hypothetical protein
MLSSITPLGERGRGSTWGVTVAAFALASTLAGAALGWALGAIGSLVLGGVSEEARLAALAVAVAIGLALDLGLGGLRLPTLRRQVNENWLGAYRGWVYGAGFGFQLGLGAATIVTTSAVYLTLLAALLAADPLAGLVIGGAFGLVRGVAVLPAWRVSSPERLFGFNAAVERGAALARRLTPIGLAAILAWATIAAAGV